MATPYDTEGAGLLPSGVLQPYGQNILKYGIGQLGTPIDVGAMTAKVAGPTGFQQKSQQRLADMYGMGDIQRDATGMLTGFTGSYRNCKLPTLLRSNFSTKFIRSISRV